MITSRIMIIVHLAANGFLKKNQFVITPGIHATSKISGRLLIHWMICSALMYVAGYAAQRIVEPVAMDQRSPKSRQMIILKKIRHVFTSLGIIWTGQQAGIKSLMSSLYLTLGD